MSVRSGLVGFFTDHYALLLYYSFLPQQSMKLTTSCLTLDAFQLIKWCLLHKTIRLNYCAGVPRASGMFHVGSAPTKRLKTTVLMKHHFYLTVFKNLLIFSFMFHVI